MSEKKKKLQEKRKDQSQRDELERMDALSQSETDIWDDPSSLIWANPSLQAPNNSLSGRAYYIDEDFTCVDCGNVEAWTAKQQQWWYEVAKGSIYSTANRCHDCRKKKQQQQQQQQQDEPTEEST